MALKRSALSVLLVVVIWPAIASAAQLTLDVALQTAIRDNADLKAARAEVNAARGRLVQAGLWPNPRFEISNETDQTFSNEGEYVRSIGLNQDVPIGGRIRRQKDVARLDVALALAALNEAERRLLGEVALGYYGVASIERQIALRERLIAVAESLVRATGERYRGGEVSTLDVNTARLELQRLRQEYAVLEGERAVKLAELVAVLGLPVGEVPELDRTLPPVETLPPISTLIDTALARRPDLLQARLSVDRAQAEQALASASAWEDWSVTLGTQKSRTALEGVPVQPRDQALTLSLSVPLPVFNRNQGLKAAAVSTEMAARERLNALERRIRQEVVARYLETSRLADAVQALDRQTLPLSAQNTDQARTAYEQGQISISDVVQIERQSLEINTGYEETLSRYFQSLVALDIATFAWADLATHINLIPSRHLSRGQ